MAVSDINKGRPFRTLMKKPGKKIVKESLAKVIN